MSRLESSLDISCLDPQQESLSYLERCVPVAICDRDSSVMEKAELSR